MKALLISLTSLMILECSQPQTIKFQLEINGNKNNFQPSDSLQLSVKSKDSLHSISYYLDEEKITVPYPLEQLPLGTHTVKAVVTEGAKQAEKIKTIQLLAETPPKLYTYELLQSYPHDRNAYTQGLEFDDELLYESTGLNGKSSLRTLNFLTGEIIKNIPLDNTYFGEGLSLLNDKVFQLTWKAGKGFIYDKTSLAMEKSFPFGESKEGWGLCNDGEFLYKSDGSNRIWKLDPNTLEELSFIQVMTHKNAVKNLNELEWVEGKIYANTYQFEKEVAVIIDPNSGAVEGVIDFSGLKEQVEQHPELNVLNGIAYHKARKTFFVTGKNWSKIFEVHILPKE